MIRHPPLARRATPAVAIAISILTSACREPDAPAIISERSMSPQVSAATLYKLRLITGVTVAGDGELQSDWFPDAGIALNTRAPWKSLTVSGATIDLVNFTHGDWTAGNCDSFRTTMSISITNWDIAGTSPVRSFAGKWRGSFGVSQTSGTTVSFDGDRVVDGVVTQSAGGIHNVVTNGNAAIETKDPSASNDWFRLEIRNAAVKFGSASSPDGQGNPVGVEVACANFSIEARKASLVFP